MPQSITPEISFLVLQRADNGGWCVYGGVSEQTASEAVESPPFAGIADDEGLLDWFAEQLVLPAPTRPVVQTALTLDVAHVRGALNEAQGLARTLQARPSPRPPGPEAAPAEHGAPPVAATTDRTEWLAEVRQCIVNRERWLAQVEPGTDEVNAARQRALQALRDLASALATGGIDAAPSQDELTLTLALQLSGIRDKLEPFATFARQTAGCRDTEYFAIRTRDDAADTFALLDMIHLRDLLRAAGMFPHEMQAPQPQAPGPAQPAEAGDPPPAPALDEDDAEEFF